jgi:hypothetical protein
MDRNAMIEAAEATIRRQDVGDEEGIVALFAEDVVFKMPVVPEPLRGRAALRERVKAWPRSITETEWIAIDGNRLVLAWSWRGEGFPEAMPPLRGVSTFVFNEDGLIQ